MASRFGNGYYEEVSEVKELKFDGDIDIADIVSDSGDDMYRV